MVHDLACGNEFDLHDNKCEGKTHFHTKGCPGLVLKQRQKATWKCLFPFLWFSVLLLGNFIGLLTAHIHFINSFQWKIVFEINHFDSSTVQSLYPTYITHLLTGLMEVTFLSPKPSFLVVSTINDMWGYNMCPHT